MGKEIRQVFVLDEADDKSMPCRVNVIKLESINGMFGDTAKELAAKFILAFSIKNKRWCGVDMSYLRTSMSKLQAHDMDLVKQGIEIMRKDGSLIIPKPKGIFSFLKKATDSEVYLSSGIINQILVNQKSVAK